MTTSIRLTVAKNAAANVARGSGAALVALAVPPFLTRLLPPETYGAWALVLQLAAYVSYFEFGIQTAVGRYVARENERGAFEHRNKIVNTALALLSAASLLALILMPELPSHWLEAHWQLVFPLRFSVGYLWACNAMRFLPRLSPVPELSAGCSWLSSLDVRATS
jgi:O-antigen/teichoic acid export membrane protein